MLIHHTKHRITHGFLAFLFLFALLICAAPAARAAPTDEAVTGWVDIQAHVPNGFKGSVSVLLENKTTGESHIVTSYYLNSYANSVEIPLGEYIVVSAFTSEDSFIYEASTETEQFALKDGVNIDVTVTHNPEGEGILANLKQNPVEELEEAETLAPDPSATTTDEAEEPTENTTPNSESSSADGATEPEENVLDVEDESEENKSDTLSKVVRNILLTIAATLVFLLGTILLVVYIRYKFGSD